MILKYRIPKSANYKNTNDDCDILINYNIADSEKRDNYQLALEKQEEIAAMMGISPIYLVPMQD